jgi:hypothetical protein
MVLKKSTFIPTSSQDSEEEALKKEILQEASWDAILAPPSNHPSNRHAKEKPWRRSSASLQRASVEAEDESTMRRKSCMPTPTAKRLPHRLQSLFSSSKVTHSPNPSVSSSKASSAPFSDWPGTQDATGRTIPAVSSSYEEEEEEESTKPDRLRLERSHLTANTSATTQDDDLAAWDIENHDIPNADDFYLAAALADAQAAQKVQQEDLFPLDASQWKGYRGFIEKTKEVPSLMDHDSEDNSSSRATSVVSSVSPSKPRRTPPDDAVSDVFDGISVASSSYPPVTSYPPKIAEEDDDDEISYLPADENTPFPLVHLPGGLTTIQTTPHDYYQRRTAHDFDDHLTNSDISSSNGFVRLPGLEQMRTAGMRRDSALRGIHGNFPERSPVGHTKWDAAAAAEEWEDYSIDPVVMKRVLFHYRTLSSEECADAYTVEDQERLEDERKAFALLEMRSRVMESDLERGLERRGGSFFVDDLVLTEYHRMAHRIRDAVIVSKAWRDGATPQDVVHTALLTRRAWSHCIARPDGQWEMVRWLDDTDFMQYRCPSLGSRHLHGFEMFTIGDCQSMLLKLTNERCVVSLVDRSVGFILSQYSFCFFSLLGIAHGAQ